MGSYNDKTFYEKEYGLNLIKPLSQQWLFFKKTISTSYRASHQEDICGCIKEYC